LPNVNKCQGITPILLFFHNAYFYFNGSEKKKNVPHSPGLPYLLMLNNKKTNTLLFFHNAYFYFNGSEKKKNVPHSPGLPYLLMLNNKKTNK
jgi:hypothetical protein